MNDTKPDIVDARSILRRCDACGTWLFPGDWLTRDGCCYCDAGLDLLTPWGTT